ncbi:MAG: DPP IV N-terminal domain-containing protein [Bacteroidetes bacterium]|nr:DPP IV N-terminal domain-containing protein [Bacteroidota bacterium]
MKIYKILIALITFGVLSAQNKLLTIQDAILKGRTSLAPLRLQNFSFIDGANQFSYILNNVLLIGDNNSGKLLPVISLTELNVLLRKENKDTLQSLNSVKWKNASGFLFTSKQSEYFYSVTEKKFTLSNKKDAPLGLEAYLEGPSAGLYSYCKNNNLYLVANGKENQITNDGSYNIVYNGHNIHQNEFGIDGKNFWSPKGNYLAFYRMDQSNVFDYPIIDWSTYPAVNKNIKYPMAGSKSHYVTLGIYSVKNNTTVFIKTEGDPEQYLTNVCWGPNEQFIYIAVLNRAQNHMKLNEYDAATGNFVRTLFEEKDEKYVEPLHPMLFLPLNTNSYLWLSRRDGYTHLYLYDLKKGFIKQLTKGKWEIKDEPIIDLKGETVFFHANEQSPVNQDYYSLALKTGKLTRLTKGNGFHSCFVNKEFLYVADVFQSAHIPREYSIINIANKKSSTIFKAENPIKEFSCGTWNLFSIKNNQGIDLYCRLFKPINFDSTKKYPVIVYLYNGPHSQLVTNTWLAGGELWYQYMAQKGYIIFTLDGRGTSYRGKEFEQIIHRQLGTAEMEDQLCGVKYLKSLPFVDANKLGVFGWSFGGFMTTSLMTRSAGIFKVGVAGGPVIDWSLYEIMYGERYMDTPQENPDGYKANNLLNHIEKLKGKFLVIHGAQDPVVVWQHSMQLIKKANDKKIQMDYYVYPGHEHNVLGIDRAHLFDKICNYFIENL